MNVTVKGNVYSLDSGTQKTAEKFLGHLAGLTGWEYLPENWAWNDMALYKFKKESTKPTKRDYAILMEKNPLSFAITSGNAIEYTLDEHGVFQSN